MTTAAHPRDSIAAFAEVQAALSDPFGDRDVTLALRGLDDRAWQSIEAAWTERLARNDDAAVELAATYGEAYESAIRAPSRGKGAPSVGVSPSAAVPSMAVASVGAPSVAVASVAVPSVGVSPSVPVAPIPPAEVPYSTSEAIVAPSRKVALPSFLKDRPPEERIAPSPSPPSLVEPPLVAPTPGYTGTAAVDLGALFKSAVPFDPSSKKSDLATPPPAPPREAPSAPSPGEPRPPEKLSKSALSGETSDVDIAAIARQVLAFGKPPSPPASAAAAPPKVPVSNVPVSNVPVSNAPSASASAPPAPSVVIRPPVASPANPALSLDQYAVLSAEIALQPDPAARAAIFARYGIQSPDAFTAEWRARFAADPTLAGRWSAAYAHHYARLRAERAGPR